MLSKFLLTRLVINFQRILHLSTATPDTGTFPGVHSVFPLCMAYMLVCTC